MTMSSTLTYTTVMQAASCSPNKTPDLNARITTKVVPPQVAASLWLTNLPIVNRDKVPFYRKVFCSTTHGEWESRLQKTGATTRLEAPTSENDVEEKGGSKILEGLLEKTFTYKPEGEVNGSIPQLGHRWKEFHGIYNWSGLLDPLDPNLRSVIIRYGEFAQATYDAFDFDTHSIYCGSCRYSRHKFLEKIGLNQTGYTVTKYLYAMSNVHLPKWFRRSHASSSWSKDSNWMGYVAVATDEKEIARLGRRDIVIAWRGTITHLEWLQDLDQVPTHPCVDANCDIMVERGFWSLYTSKSEKTRYNKKSASEQVMEEVKRLIQKYKDEELSITITGHSLGGALALLSACEISQYIVSNVSRDVLSPPFVSVFTFGGPRVGNEGFKNKVEELGVKTLRIVNENDLVPKVPGILLNEQLGNVAKLCGAWLKKVSWGYVHAGMKFVVNNTLSPFLNPDGSVLDFHNLEAYLHLVDGYQGMNAEFQSITGRDVALVNKSSDFVKKELLVPPCWYQLENKGLIKGKDGKWIQAPREEDDIPVPSSR